MSENIYTLIPKVMADIGAVSKDRRNEQQKYAFRGIDQFYQAAHPALVKHGVFCVPEVLEHYIETFERHSPEYNRTTHWRHVMLKVNHKFYAPDGSHIDVITMGEGLDNSDKATNKAMSGAMKYALIELFSVPTEDIEDADKTSPEAGKAQPVTLISKKTVVAPAAPVKPPESGPDPESLKTEPFEEEYISTTQRSYLSKRFRESLKEELEPRANELRHAALTAMEQSKLFKSRFIDANGNPTQDFILVQEYSQVGAALVKAAKSL